MTDYTNIPRKNNNKIYLGISVVLVLLLLFFTFFVFPPKGTFNEWESRVIKNEMTGEEEYFLFMVGKTSEEYSPTTYIFAEAKCGVASTESSVFIQKETPTDYQDILLSFSGFTDLGGSVESAKAFKSEYSRLVGGMVTFIQIIDTKGESKTPGRFFIRTKDFKNLAEPFLLRKYNHNDFVHTVNPWTNVGMEPHFLENVRIRLEMENGEPIIIDIPVYSDLFNRFFDYCKNR